MAVTKIIKIKTNVKACINYVINKDKTDEGALVTYSGCQYATADYYFKLALDENKRKKDDPNSIKAYHLIQSFAPSDELNEETAHKIGLELAERLFKGEYAFVCGTHTDKGHLHNHIVICAAKRDMSGRKINDNLTLLHNLQKTSDALCRENELSVIDKKKGKGKQYREWIEATNNPKGSKKLQLCHLIDEQIKQSTDFDDFIEHMKAAGAEVSFGTSKKYGQVTKYKLPNAIEKDRWNRGYNLGAGYSDDMIKKRIAFRLHVLEERANLRQERVEKRKAERAAMSNADKAIDRTKTKIKHIIDTSNDEVSSSNIALEKWRNIQNARRAEEIKETLRNKYGIDFTQIKAKINSLEAENNRKSAEISNNISSIKNFRDYIEACIVYMDTYAIKDKYDKSKDQDRYYRNHDAALNAYANAMQLLERTSLDLSILRNKDKGSSYINDFQKELSKLEEINYIHEQDIKNNQKAINELRGFQKELDLYHNRTNDSL